MMKSEALKAASFGVGLAVIITAIIGGTQTVLEYQTDEDLSTTTGD